jgi:hypothetical protein
MMILKLQDNMAVSNINPLDSSGGAFMFMLYSGSQLENEIDMYFRVSVLVHILTRKAIVYHLYPPNHSPVKHSAAAYVGRFWAQAQIIGLRRANNA